MIKKRKFSEAFKLSFLWRGNEKRVLKYFADKKENPSFNRQIKNDFF